MVNKYFEAPAWDIDYTNKCERVFLAGGISNCEDWQDPMARRILAETAAVVYNPRRENFDITRVAESEEQIRWEHFHLRRADTILFWFTSTSVCPITLFEYGFWLGQSEAYNKQIFVGADSAYIRRFDLEEQTKLVHPHIEICDSLEALTTQVIAHLNL